MVKLLETSGVIEKTHVVLCAEHGPNKRTVSVSCMRVSFHFFFCVDSVLAKASTQCTTGNDSGCEPYSWRDEIRAKGETFNGRLPHSTLDAFWFLPFVLCSVSCNINNNWCSTWANAKCLMNVTQLAVWLTVCFTRYPRNVSVCVDGCGQQLMLGRCE